MTAKKYTRYMVAKLFGVAKVTVHNWEKRGHLVAFRDDNGNPYYTADQLQNFKRPERHIKSAPIDVEAERAALGIVPFNLSPDEKSLQEKRAKREVELEPQVRRLAQTLLDDESPAQKQQRIEAQIEAAKKAKKDAEQAERTRKLQAERDALRNGDWDNDLDYRERVIRHCLYNPHNPPPVPDELDEIDKMMWQMQVDMREKMTLELMQYLPTLADTLREAGLEDRVTERDELTMQELWELEQQEIEDEQMREQDGDEP